MSEKEEQQRPQDQEEPKGSEHAEPAGDDEGADVEGHVKKAARVGARIGHKPRN